MNIDFIIDKYCSGKNVKLSKDKVEKVIKLSLEGTPLTIVAEKTNMSISTINTLKARFNRNYGINFPKTKLNRRSKAERKASIGHTREPKKVFDTDKIRKLSRKEQEFVRSYDLNAINNLLAGLNLYKSQTSRISIIAEDLNIDYEVARQLYHRYKREVSTWAV